MQDDATAVRSIDGREVIWEATPRQSVALTCPAFEVGYGGQKGGGKTDFLVASPFDQILYAQEEYVRTGRLQRGRFILFRKTTKELSDLIARTKEVYPVLDPMMGMGGWNKTERRWTFSSGYVVDITHLEGPDDHQGYNGQEITGAGFDQLEQFPESVYLFIRMNIRSKDAGMRKRLKCVSTFNPGGRHAAWVKKYWITGVAPNKIIENRIKLRNGKERIVTKAFIPARLEDNPYLSADGAYEANLRNLPLWMQRMYLEGDWDVVQGAFFAHVFDPSIHLIPSFPIPDAWPLKGGNDWGATAPACTLFGVRDPDGNIYIIDELYRPGITGRTYGEALKQKVTRQKWFVKKKVDVTDFYILADRQIRATTGGDGTYSNPAAGIASFGFRLFDANKDRIAGIEQITERLLVQPDGKPTLYIFKDRCPNLARTLPGLESDPHNPEDIDGSAEDHAFDALRYLLMDWPVGPKVKETIKEDPEVERWLAMAKARQREHLGDDVPQTAGYGDD